MEFLPKRQARFTFLQYVFSKMYVPETQLKDVIDICYDRYFCYEPNKEYVTKLAKYYDDHNSDLNEIVKTLFDNRVTFDKTILAMALCAICEVQSKYETQVKLVISEYVKLCLVTENNTKLLNGILHNFLTKFQSQ